MTLEAKIKRKSQMMAPCHTAIKYTQEAAPTNKQHVEIV